MSPELSVVVPFYGVENYIESCLQSLRRQRLHDIEVILVDDGSKDGSRDIAQRFVELDPRFTLITQENAGLGPARNTGAERASGNYLAFVDSDDLVSARGFEKMVGMLDRSGSSFAGGNARRFNNSSGVRQSWSHRNAFAKTLIGTHVVEHPVLARDRMVWNKVYRRTFWDEFSYAFPAIRYEDYPVTFKAHLEAVTVDVLSDPVYYWRERESGDSITQHAYRYDNLLDRVVSAEMVLDQADGSSPEVRRQIYSGLNESDFVAIVQAFASVGESEAPGLLALGGRLADRLGEDVAGSGHPYTFIQYRALQAGDTEVLRELAEFRGGGGLRGMARGSRRPMLPWRLEYPYPGRGARSVPRNLYTVPRREVRLATSVTEVVGHEGSLRLRGTAEIRHHVSTEDTLVEMRIGNGDPWIPLEVSIFDAIDSHGERNPVGFEVTLDASLLNQVKATGKSLSAIEVTVHSGRMRRTGKLHGARPGNPVWTPCLRISDDVWAQPATTSQGHFVLSWLRKPWVLREVVGYDDGLRLVVKGRGAVGPEPTIRLGGSSPKLAFVTAMSRTDGETELVADIPADTVVGSVSHDDPFVHQSVRALWLDVDIPDRTRPELLLWRAPDCSVGVTRGDHLVTVTRTQGNRTSLVESPLRPSAQEAHVHDDTLVVCGTNWTASDRATFMWRQYFPNSDDFIEVSGTLEVDETTWRLSTPLANLIETTTYSHDIQNRGEWVLFYSWEGHDAAAVVPDPFLLTSLPLLYDAGSRQGTLAPAGETLHFRVNDRG